MSIDIEEIAARLDTAAVHARAIAQISQSTALTLAHAYAVQKASIARRLARGERRIGLKMGFTSRAKMEQMGASDLIWGRLTDAMLVEDGASISLARFVDPRVEPGIAFLTRKPLAGRISTLQALEAVEAIAPALEIVDSRYQNSGSSLTDVVADNSSSSAFTVGPWNWHGEALDNLGLVLSVNGRARAFGSTAAILGDPVRSLVSAARLAAESGEAVEAGSIVLAGGATAAIALEQGMHVALELERLGRTSFTAGSGSQ